MESRANKYNEDGLMSRTKKNENLYENVNDTEIDSFDINSNTTILGNNNSTIDIDKLRDMLDKKYREEPHNRAILDNNEDGPKQEINLDETREYDINTILDKAKENKESDYEVERLKKLRNTQVDILNSLDINNNNVNDNVDIGNEKAISNGESQKLLDLINTINITEATQQVGKLDPLDLLSDLKGNDENTVVMGANDNDLSQTETDIKGNDQIDKSFYTTSNMFTQSDFDDFNDLKEEVSSTKIIIKILVVVVVIAFIVGVVFLLNRILGWGLF